LKTKAESGIEAHNFLQQRTHAQNHAAVFTAIFCKLNSAKTMFGESNNSHPTQTTFVNEETTMAKKMKKAAAKKAPKARKARKAVRKTAKKSAKKAVRRKTAKRKSKKMAR